MLVSYTRSPIFPLTIQLSSFFLHDFLSLYQKEARNIFESSFPDFVFAFLPLESLSFLTSNSLLTSPPLDFSSCHYTFLVSLYIIVTLSTQAGIYIYSYSRESYYDRSYCAAGSAGLQIEDNKINKVDLPGSALCSRLGAVVTASQLSSFRILSSLLFISCRRSARGVENEGKRRRGLAHITNGCCVIRSA